MTNSSQFREQAAAWQRYLRQKQTGGWLQRLVAWLFFGVLLTIGLALLVFFILLSWLLIPFMIYRARKRMRAAQQQTQYRYRQDDPNIIEGEIVESKEHVNSRSERLK